MGSCDEHRGIIRFICLHRTIRKAKTPRHHRSCVSCRRKPRDMSLDCSRLREYVCLSVANLFCMNTLPLLSPIIIGTTLCVCGEGCNRGAFTLRTWVGHEQTIVSNALMIESSFACSNYICFFSCRIGTRVAQDNEREARRERTFYRPCLARCRCQIEAKAWFNTSEASCQNQKASAQLSRLHRSGVFSSSEPWLDEEISFVRTATVCLWKSEQRLASPRLIRLFMVIDAQTENIRGTMSSVSQSCSSCIPLLLTKFICLSLSLY